MTFKELPIIAPILRAVEEQGYTQPTPIQQQSIPLILKKQDVLGCAQTGTGKTAAFSIPILQLLSEDNKPVKGVKPIRCLTLTPTRELAIQIAESVSAYGKHLHIRHTVVFGGVSQYNQVQDLKKGVDILIATPGRLLDLIQQGLISLRQLEIFVLDEADRMLDMGFINDVKKVIKLIPEQRQTLFFSATMPKEIQALADTLLRNPTKVEVAPVSSTAEKITQSLYYVSKNDKIKLLHHLLKKTIDTEVLVFNRTKHGADKIVKQLLAMGIKAAAIHGNKSQNQRQMALNNFKDGKLKVLVATDIAARGIDIDALKYVVNYDLPNVPETYVHRIGRSGRAGKEGVALSFCAGDELEDLKSIQKLIQLDIPLINDHPYAIGEQEMTKAAQIAKVEKKTKNAQNSGRRTPSDKPNLSGGKKKSRFR